MPLNSLGKSSVKNITGSLGNYLRKAHENVENLNCFMINIHLI